MNYDAFVWYCAFGQIEIGSPIWNRAQRLQLRFGRDATKYLDAWAQFQFVEKGKRPEESIESRLSCVRARDARASHTSTTATPDGDSTEA